MDPPDILFWCCSRQLWCLNWKRPGAVSVEFSMARQWGDTAILSIFFWYWYGFLFQCRVFPAYNFLHYQYKSTNNLHLHLQDAADVEPFVVRKVSDHNNEQLNLREVGKLCVAKKTKGSCSVFIQVSTHDFDPKRIGFTHNSSASQACWNNQHFTCLCSRNNQDQAPQQEQPFECGSCKKQGECENKVYLVLVIQNNMSVHLQVDSELGCKIFWHIEIS